jgi:hypothetical protein
MEKGREFIYLEEDVIIDWNKLPDGTKERWIELSEKLVSGGAVVKASTEPSISWVRLHPKRVKSIKKINQIRRLSQPKYYRDILKEIEGGVKIPRKIKKEMGRWRILSYRTEKNLRKKVNNWKLNWKFK